MPVFYCECGSCGHVGEYAFGMDDERVFGCAECGDKQPVDGHRLYGLEGLQISGDTVAGGCNLSGYFDEGLGEYVVSRGHRQELMRKKGLAEYSPDPEMKAHRDEARYIRENAPKGDPIAAAAARKELKTAADKRRDRLVNETFEKAKI